MVLWLIVEKYKDLQRVYNETYLRYQMVVGQSFGMMEPLISSFFGNNNSCST